MIPIGLGPERTVYWPPAKPLKLYVPGLTIDRGGRGNGKYVPSLSRNSTFRYPAKRLRGFFLRGQLSIDDRGHPRLCGLIAAKCTSGWPTMSLGEKATTTELKN